MPRKSEKEKLINAICTQAAIDVITADSSDDEELMDKIEIFNIDMIALLSHRRSVHLNVPKTHDWAERVLLEFDEGRYCQMLRMSVTEFDYILSLLKDDPIFSRNHVPQLPIKLQLQITLFRLGSYGEGGSIRKIATMFGVGDGGTIQKITKRVFKAILKLKERFIKWPTEAERLQIVENTMDELPGCIGYIDGTEFRLSESPANNHEVFFSRKRRYSIKMQGICDYKLRIRQATIGYQGSVHDAKIFSESPIARSPENYFSNLQWIAGDSAYSLRENIITPYLQVITSNELTKESRDKYNEYFSGYRVRIENCFGKLKEKLASLKELKIRLKDDKNYKDCCDWILVCCILHNALIDFNSPENDQRITHNNYPEEFFNNENLRNALVDYIINKNN